MASKSASMTDGQGFQAAIWPLRTALLTLMLIGIFWAYGIAAQSFLALRAEPEAPIEQVQSILKEDLARSLPIPATLFDATDLAVTFGDETRAFVIKLLTGGMRTLLNVPDSIKGRKSTAADDPDPGGTFFKTWWVENGHYVELALWANYIFCIRTLMFVAALPLAVIAYFVAFVDGFAARLVRRADAARESSSLYHRVKISQVWALSLAYITYLSMPVSIPPEWVVLPTVAACALFARWQAALYKKYA